MPNHIRKGKLDKEDLEIIRSFKWLEIGGYLLLILLICIGGFLIHYGIFEAEKLYNRIVIPLSGAFFFVFIPGFIAYYLIFAKIEETADIRAGNKEIIQGVITDKQIRKRVGTDSSAEPGGFIDQINQFHYLILGDIEFLVNKDVYRNYEIGDTVDVHYIPSTRFFIKAEKASKT